MIDVTQWGRVEKKPTEAADEIARLAAELAAARAEIRKLIDACKQHIRGDHDAEWGCDMVFDRAVAAAEKWHE